MEGQLFFGAVLRQPGKLKLIIKGGGKNLDGIGRHE